MASHCLQVKAFILHWYKINIMDNCNFLETEQANPWHWFWLFRWPNPQTEMKRAGRSFWLESNQIKITSFTFNLCKSISANTPHNQSDDEQRGDEIQVRRGPADDFSPNHKNEAAVPRLTTSGSQVVGSRKPKQESGLSWCAVLTATFLHTVAHPRTGCVLAC